MCVNNIMVVNARHFVQSLLFGILINFNIIQGSPCPSSCPGNFTLHSIFSDGMVLQAEPQVTRIFGFTTCLDYPVKLNRTCSYSTGKISEVNQTSSFSVAKTAGLRTWEVELSPQANGVVCHIETSQGNITRTVHHAQYGDVWICTGQSNMMMPIKDVKNGTEELLSAKFYDNIKMSHAKGRLSEVEVDDFDRVHKWGPINKWSSAMCYFFAKYLVDEVLSGSHVIGLHRNALGASTVEAWMAPEAIESCREEEQVGDRGYVDPDAKNASFAWNARVYPLLRFPIKGVLMSMGDVNPKYHRPGFRCLFETLISSWRSAWSLSPSGDFPVGFELLRHGGQAAPDKFPAPIYRWHQTSDRGYVPNARLPGVFMGVSLDIVEPDHLMHPMNKQRIARRLGIAAANVAYGRREYPANGPFPADVRRNGTEVLIRYGERIRHDPFDDTVGLYVCCESDYASCDSESVYRWRRARPDSAAVDATTGDIRLDLVGQCADEYNPVGVSETQVGVTDIPVGVADTPLGVADTPLGVASTPVGVAFLYDVGPVKKDGHSPIYAEDNFGLPAMPWKMELSKPWTQTL